MGMPGTLRRVGAGLALAAAAACAGHGGAPGPAADPEPLLQGVRQLTFAGRRSGEGYFDASGHRLVFQSEREPGNPFYQIYLMDLATGALERVSPGVGKTTCGWIHPDGSRVLFASTHHDPQAPAKQEAELAERAAGTGRRYAWDFDPEFELWERDLASGALRRLTRAPGYDAEAAWSPDGRRIVFASNRHAFGGSLAPEEAERFEADPSVAMELYVREADGVVRRLTHAPGYDGGPFWSADGRRIVWRRFSPDGTRAEIWVRDVDGGPERPLTRLGALSWAPFFHPSGDYVVFATNLLGHANFELYLVDAAGISEPVRVTFQDRFDGLPAFAPDGRQLAWTSQRSGDASSQIFLAAWDEVAARRALGLAPAARSPASPAGPTSPPEAGPLRAHVVRLTAPEMAGRETGTDGERRAAAYVAGVFASLGLEPAGAEGGWLQPFDFTAGVSLAPGNELVLERSGAPPRAFAVDADWRPLGFSRSGEAGPAPVVFAGYGIVAPAVEGVEALDAYGDLDVAGRWVLVLRQLPSDVAPEVREHWSRFASLRHKATLARDRGALGLLVASGPRTPVRDPLVPLRIDGSAATAGIAALSVADPVAEALLAATGRDLASLQEALDRGEPLPAFPLPGATLAARVALVQERRQGRNVLARLPAEGPASGRPALVIGAHVDHLGRGLGGSSMAREEERGRVHPGADDNASGVAALLEIARQLSEARGRGELVLARDVIFAAWSGEELGLLGAEHFVRNLVPGDDGSDRVAAYLNLDMVGRLERALVLQGVGSSPRWPAVLERVAAPVGLPIRTQDETYLPTDSTAFYLKRVPFLSAFTGAHADYHTPRDTAEKLRYPELARVATLVARLAQEVASRPEAPVYVAKAPPPGDRGRAGLRAYLGTIPDYVEAEAGGLRLSGVVEGGPAARAGLRAGDVIVELAGRRVENVYDYTYAIEALVAGRDVEVVVLRAGRRLPLRITPEPRE